MEARIIKSEQDYAAASTHVATFWCGNLSFEQRREQRTAYATKTTPDIDRGWF